MKNFKNRVKNSRFWHILMLHTIFKDHSPYIRDLDIAFGPDQYTSQYYRCSCGSQWQYVETNPLKGDYDGV